MSTPELLPCVEIETGSNPRHTVIWLHGLGADGNDFAPVVPELGLPENLPVRFLFPHAPYQPVSCNNGYVMRAWYDILYFEDIKRHADVTGVKATLDAIAALIAAENARGIPSSQIVLAGFSQGGAIAYTAGLLHSEKLAGIVALSTYLPAPELLDNAGTREANATTPVMACHGSHDPVVPVQLGLQAYETVKGFGNPASWHTWPIQHSVCLPEIQLIGQFLTRVLA
ncbi:alpha/beta hydrolase [Chitinilyticum piscinae]|uniref:Dienelactone hydrolase family protein n=1 Tax=Chitinilyticum piscinae TaxID=2866724 RepID=A0A8J7K1X0_9NEIS|nr:dienelactone hydrolase family protein [Chitinilyticum piscinae]MBE9609806.1 dienelactone hydrolase family protein [Chitinilyticum piscinae]